MQNMGKKRVFGPAWQELAAPLLERLGMDPGAHQRSDSRHPALFADGFEHEQPRPQVFGVVGDPPFPPVPLDEIVHQPLAGNGALGGAEHVQYPGIRIATGGRHRTLADGTRPAVQSLLRQFLGLPAQAVEIRFVAVSFLTSAKICWIADWSGCAASNAWINACAPSRNSPAAPRVAFCRVRTRAEPCPIRMCKGDLWSMSGAFDFSTEGGTRRRSC
jgi:hypothetical protein